LIVEISSDGGNLCEENIPRMPKVASCCSSLTMQTGPDIQIFSRMGAMELTIQKAFFKFYVA